LFTPLIDGIHLDEKAHGVNQQRIIGGV
jgi:hypothetical protein